MINSREVSKDAHISARIARKITQHHNPHLHKEANFISVNSLSSVLIIHPSLSKEAGSLVNINRSYLVEDGRQMREKFIMPWEFKPLVARAGSKKIKLKLEM